MTQNDQAVPGSSGSGSKALSCKLTDSEIRHRKATVIARIKDQVNDKKELDHGFSFGFAGSDHTVDLLADFIKTERLCCDFFDFTLQVKGDASAIWLTVTGPEGTKEFLTNEMGL